MSRGTPPSQRCPVRDRGDGPDFLGLCRPRAVHGGDLSATYGEQNKGIPVALVPEGWEPRSWHRSAGPGIRYDLVSECEWFGSTLGMTMENRPQRTVIGVRAGFPMLAMGWGVYDARNPRVGLPWLIGVWHDGVSLKGTLAGRLPRPLVEPRLPLRPLWFGFCLNTAIYSLFAWGMIAGVGAWRRERRRSRGLCVACGHPLAGLSVCPECGLRGPIPTIGENREGAEA